MSGFGRALARGLAGGLQGFGVGLAKQAEEARKEALAERAERRADARVADDRAFRSGESALDRASRAELAASQQEFSASESALDRKARMDAARLAASRRNSGAKPKVRTLPDGRIGVFIDGKFNPYTEQDGTPIVTEAKKEGSELTLPDGTTGKIVDNVFVPYVDSNGDPLKVGANGAKPMSETKLTTEYMKLFEDDFDKTPEEKEAAANALARKRLGIDGGTSANAPEAPKLPTEPEKANGQPVYLPKTAEDLANIRTGEQYRSPTDGRLYVKK